MIEISDKPMMIKEFRQEIERSSNIFLHLNSKITSVSEEEKGLTAVIHDVQLNKEEILHDEGMKIFSFIGQIPNTEILNGQIELDNGYILSHESETSLPGVFSCGDINVKKIRQVSTAVCDGTIAAISAHNFLLNQ